MAGWSDWVKYLLADPHGNKCGHVCGIYGPASTQYQYYASEPPNFHPGVEFFQSMDKIFSGGVGQCGSVLASVPVDGDPKNLKFMIIRELDDCISAKCGNEAGFSVSKTKNLYIVSFYTKNEVLAGNCEKQNSYVQSNLLQAGQ